MMQLIYVKSRKPVQVGDIIKSGRTKFRVSNWMAPQHINSSGRVFVSRVSRTMEGQPESFFPHVFDLKFIEKKLTRTELQALQLEQRYRTPNQLGDALYGITRGCRNDMHEPDEQDVTATIRGRVFDNAGSNNELTVVITNYTTGMKDEFNLATLIAMARAAALRLDLDKELS